MLEVREILTKDSKALAEKNIDLIAELGKMQSSGTMSTDVLMTILYILYPDKTEEIDEMPFLKAFELGMKVMAKSFGGDEEQGN